MMTGGARLAAALLLAGAKAPASRPPALCACRLPCLRALFRRRDPSSVSLPLELLRPVRDARLCHLTPAGLATSHCFAARGFCPAGLRPASFDPRRSSCALRSIRQQTSLVMSYDGDVSTWIKRNFGETFFLAGAYQSDDKTLSKEWNFQRTWVDFAKLDRAMRLKYPDKLGKLPPKPYLVGEEASFMPFQKYLENLLSIPGAYEEPEVYEFLATPSDVITSAFRGRVPIDVVAEGGRYAGEKEGGGKYVPTLDPVILAADAGKSVKQAKEALAAAEISKKAGSFAAGKTSEWKEAAAPVVEEVSKAIADSGVSSKSTGKAVGGILANLRSGRGLFGEEGACCFFGT